MTCLSSVTQCSGCYEVQWEFSSENEINPDCSRRRWGQESLYWEESWVKEWYDGWTCRVHGTGQKIKVHMTFIDENILVSVRPNIIYWPIWILAFPLHFPWDISLFWWSPMQRSHLFLREKEQGRVLSVDRWVRYFLLDALSQLLLFQHLSQ